MVRMPARPSPRKPPLKACLHCGALAPRDAEVCPVCGGTRFTDEWSGMIVVIDGERSLVAGLIGKGPGIYAIKVAGKVVVRR